MMLPVSIENLLHAANRSAAGNQRYKRRSHRGNRRGCEPTRGRQVQIELAHRRTVRRDERACDRAHKQVGFADDGTLNAPI